MQQRIAWLLTIHSPDEDRQQRGRIVLVITLGLLAMSLLDLPLTFSSPSWGGLIAILASLPIYIGVFFLVRQGRVSLGAFSLIALFLVGIFSTALANGDLSVLVFYLGLPLLVASLTLRPWQIWPVLLVNLLGVTLLSTLLPISPWADGLSRTIFLGGVAFLGLISVISFLGASGMARTLRQVRQTRTQLETSAADLVRSNVELEQRVAERTAALQTALTEVQTRAAENEQQRTTIREMSVPVIPVSDTTLIIPLIGALDGGRLAQLNGQALQAVERAGTRHLILDITGVFIVDSQVAQGIIAVVQSARLLGTEVILVGVRPEVAQTIVQLGLNLVGMRTFSTLQSALIGIHNQRINVLAPPARSSQQYSSSEM